MATQKIFARSPYYVSYKAAAMNVKTADELATTEFLDKYHTAKDGGPLHHLAHFNVMQVSLINEWV